MKTVLFIFYHKEQDGSRPRSEPLAFKISRNELCAYLSIGELIKQNTNPDQTLSEAFKHLDSSLEKDLDSAGLDQEQRDMFWSIVQNMNCENIHHAYSNCQWLS